MPRLTVPYKLAVAIRERVAKDTLSAWDQLWRNWEPVGGPCIPMGAAGTIEYSEPDEAYRFIPFPPPTEDDARRYAVTTANRALAAIERDNEILAAMGVYRAGTMGE